MTGPINPLILITDDHWYAGGINTNGERVLDALNNHNTDYVRLQGVNLFRKEDAQKSVASFPEIIIAKAKVDLVIIPTGKHENPEKRLFARVSKNAFETMIIVAGYEIRGNLQLSRSADTLALMTRDLGTFFPVTDATVSCTGHQGITAPVVMVNKSVVTSIYTPGCANVDKELDAALSV